MWSLPHCMIYFSVRRFTWYSPYIFPFLISLHYTSLEDNLLYSPPLPTKLFKFKSVNAVYLLPPRCITKHPQEKPFILIIWSFSALQKKIMIFSKADKMLKNVIKAHKCNNKMTHPFISRNWRLSLFGAKISESLLKLVSFAFKFSQSNMQMLVCL